MTTNESALLAYVNTTPALLSLLYDCGLMPETHIEHRHDKSKMDWERMLTIAAHWQAHCNEPAAVQALQPADHGRGDGEHFATTPASAAALLALCDEIAALKAKATPGPHRVSRSGYSIKAGEQDAKRIIATAPRAVLSSDADCAAFQEWFENAETYVELFNAADTLLAAARASVPITSVVHRLLWGVGQERTFNSVEQRLAELTGYKARTP